MLPEAGQENLLGASPCLSFPRTSSEGETPADERESSKTIRHEGVLQPLERNKKTLIFDLVTERLRRM
jgi:hypothetical protein